MDKIQIKTKKSSGSYGNRIIYLKVKNISNEVLPKSNYSLKVKEGNKVVHNEDYHVIGPLEPGEYSEHIVDAQMKNGLFTKQELLVKMYGEVHQLSVGKFR